MWIGTTWRVKKIEIDAASTKRHRNARTGAGKAEQLHLGGGNWRRFADVESYRFIEGGRSLGMSCNKPKSGDFPENHLR